MHTSLTKLFRTTVYRERIASPQLEHIQNFPHHLRVIHGDNGMQVVTIGKSYVG